MAAILSLLAFIGFVSVVFYFAATISNDLEDYEQEYKFYLLNNSK